MNIPYLYISIGINIILLLIVIGLISFKSLRNLIRKLILDAEKLVPGTTGEEKRAWVIEKLKQSTFLAKFLSNATIIDLIEKTIKYLNSFSKNK